ncbi:MAG: hypothetical protein Q4F17_08820 [Eubacteriales bacterium]|nr:hypothetical protein [Eubacteriales bacterium]
MKASLKAVLRQLLGPGYGQAGKSLLTCGILFCSLYFAEIRLKTAPIVVYLTSFALSGAALWQSLQAAGRGELVRGLLLLPGNGRRLPLTLALAFGTHTLLTRTAPVWAVLAAVSPRPPLEMAAALLWGIHGCLAAAGAWALAREKRGMLSWLAALSIPGAAVWYLLHMDPYRLLAEGPASRARRLRAAGVAGYLLRYLLDNKGCLVNTLAMAGAGCVLPALLGRGLLALGLAMVTMNTPLSVLISRDRDLELALGTLPGRGRRFCRGYWLGLSGVNLAVSSVYLLSFQVQIGGVAGREALLAVLFALQSALLSVRLEWKHPIRGWKTESDLWRHPRKYLTPVAMLLAAVAVSTWPVLIWVWPGVLGIEWVLFFLFPGECGLPRRCAAGSQ